MRHAFLPLLTLLLALAGCEGDTRTIYVERPNANGHPPPVTQPAAATIPSPGLDPAIFPAVGATDFTTANERELLSAGTQGGFEASNGRGELATDEDSDGAAEGADPGQAPPADPGVPEAVPDPSREIVEADVYKLEGDYLYVLNRHRGLVILDVSDPDDLRVVGRLPFQAVPVEMYVREGRAYIVMSDYFTYWQYDADADPQGFHGSQVLIADIEDPAHPEALGSLPVEGEISDTRMVGDVLYTVSKRRPDYWRYNTADWEDRTWVVSLNVADPQDIREIDRVTFSGTSTLIHVAHHAVFVAAWDPNFYLTDPNNEQETLVTYVDISDPAGDLQTRGQVYIPGQIADKFKMDWFDGAFRVFSQRWSTDGNITLHVVDTDLPDDLEIDASLELDGLTRSGLQATRFDGPRGFAMSNRWQNNGNQPIQELHTLDLSDAGRPHRAAKLRIPLAVTHFEVHGDRLLAMGQHRPADWNRESRAALGLFDISDLAAPVELSVTRLGEGWSSSGANQDYKALKVFRDLSLILIPLSYWDNDRREHFNGLQIVDWRGDDLVERGRVENGGGVRRGFPVGDRVVAVGDMSIATIDAADRDRPRVTDRLDLIHAVHDVFDIQGLQVQLVNDVYEGGVRLEVRQFEGEDDGPRLAALDLPFQGVPNVYRDGDILHMIGWVQREGYRGQTIVNADLSDPRAPRLRGELLLTDDYQRIYNEGYTFYMTYWSPYAGLPLRNQIIPITFRRIVASASGRRDFESALRFVDLRDPDAPRIAEGVVPMNEFPFVNKVTHGETLYSTHVEQATTPEGEGLLFHVKSYVDRVDVSDPDRPVLLPPVNVPGYLVDVSEDGRLWVTVDFQWDDFGRRRNSLNTLVLEGEGEEAVARLVSVVPISDQIDRAAFRPTQDSLSVWLASHKYPWWGVRSDTPASRQPYTVLERIDVDADGAVAAHSRATLQGYHFDLLDLEAGRAYLGSTGPYGLLVLNVADAARPQVEHAARTIGYLSRIAVFAGSVYAPMGWFGVHRY